MKSKKKVGLVKRIAAGVCAMMLAVVCMGTVPYYAVFLSPEDLVEGRPKQFIDTEYVPCNYNFDVSTVLSDYEYYFITDASPGYSLYLSNEPFVFNVVDYADEFSDEQISFLITAELRLSNVVIYDSDDGYDWDYWKTMDSMIFGKYHEGYYASGESFSHRYYAEPLKIVYSNCLFSLPTGYILPCHGYDASLGYSYESYNSSLGYLQDVHGKKLTLDGENYDPDYDSWQVMFTFDSTSTTGLDITTGGYSVRHFLEWEVRDRDSNVVRSYDKVKCGEYDAANCNISYPLYSTRQAAMEECGFEALSWWESGILGYEVYIYDYLQLVRTNEDGSVEYGGYVRIDEHGYVVDTLDDNFIEDPNGYLDQDFSTSFGSGSNYEDAEHDADKNANNSSDSSTDLLSQINLLTSVIKAVPELIMEVFSFLPDWCLDLVGVAFTLSIMITIYKLAT